MPTAPSCIDKCKCNIWIADKMHISPLRIRYWWGKLLPQNQNGTSSTIIYTRWSSRHEGLWCHAAMVNGAMYYLNQGWGQFHFFNSIPIPIPLFSIPIPIPLLTISFNSNSNSNSGDFNSNSNSGDFKSRQSQFWKWPVDVFFEIDYDYTNKVHAYKIIVINTISLILLVKWL